MQTRKDDGVFPLIDSEGEFLNTDFGLTKREYFAAQAMQGILSSSRYYYKDIPSESVATEAVKMANELIKALNT